MSVISNKPLTTPFIFYIHNKTFILNVYGSYEYPWFSCPEVSRILGIKNPTDLTKHLKETCKTYIDIIDPIGRTQKTTLINEMALKRIILKSRKKIPHEFLEWLKTLNIFIDTIYERDETATIYIIQQAFMDCNTKKECVFINSKNNKSYRVDLLFTDENLIIECDEYGHKNYDKTNEMERQKYFEDLGYKLIRYNPNDKHFNIGKVIYEIRCRIGRQ